MPEHQFSSFNTSRIKSGAVTAVQSLASPVQPTWDAVIGPWSSLLYKIPSPFQVGDCRLRQHRWLGPRYTKTSAGLTSSLSASFQSVRVDSRSTNRHSLIVMGENDLLSCTNFTIADNRSNASKKLNGGQFHLNFQATTRKLSAAPSGPFH